MNTLENDSIVRYGFLSDFASENFFDVLDIFEKKRADKFILAEDRLRFVTCRSVLKVLLSPLLDIPAVKIQFEYSPNGKPMLPGMNSIQFSVSHCRNIMLWGISNGNAIGVDVEHSEIEISENVFASVCSEEELSEMKRTPEQLRHAFIVDRWTKKEAVLKAMGCRAEMLALLWPEIVKDQWMIESVDLLGGYRGAVAIRGKTQLKIIGKKLSVSSILSCV